MPQTVFLRISILFLVTGLVACYGKNDRVLLPYYNSPDFTPMFFTSDADATQKVKHTIAPFLFTDQHGKQISEKDVAGKIHVANFIFTRCVSICPVMTDHMKILQKEFQNNPDVVMLSYSVTPWIDSVNRLQKYAVDKGITSPYWHLLTGNKSEIYRLARQSYFAEEDIGFSRDSSDFLHTEHLVLVDRNLHIRGIYNGTLQLEAEQLVKDIRRLLKEDE